MGSQKEKSLKLPRAMEELVKAFLGILYISEISHLKMNLKNIYYWNWLKHARVLYGIFHRLGWRNMRSRAKNICF